jgi:FlaA1/EpsC-like NDP-sugar epimerase
MRIIRTQPIYLILLPVFFILHGYLENYGFISVKDASVLLISYVVQTALIFLFSYIFFRNKNKAALITFMWMAFFFFFAALHEFLRQQSPIHLASRYGFLLGTFTILFVIIFVYLM